MLLPAGRAVKYGSRHIPVEPVNGRVIRAIYGDTERAG
jgi:hypothetical protein